MGLRKRLRQAQKVNYAQATGTYRSGRSVSEGVKRAAKRLALFRAATRVRLRDVSANDLATRQQNRSYYFRGR